jgi:hypothetical protein
VAVADITKAEIERLDMTKSMRLGLAIAAGAAAVMAAWAAVTRAAASERQRSGFSPGSRFRPMRLKSWHGADRLVSSFSAEQFCL